MNFCNHGMLFGQEQCIHCELTKRLEKIEQAPTDLINKVKELEKIINEPKDCYLSFDIKKLNDRLDNVENGILPFMRAKIDNIGKGLENYREYKTGIEDLNTDVMYLKQHIKQYHELVLGACPLDIEKTIRENMKGKLPHKCPVCEGSGGVKHPLTGLIVPAKCHACEGKGIVWS